MPLIKEDGTVLDDHELSILRTVMEETYDNTIKRFKSNVRTRNGRGMDSIYSNFLADYLEDQKQYISTLLYDAADDEEPVYVKDFLKNYEEDLKTRAISTYLNKLRMDDVAGMRAEEDEDEVEDAQKRLPELWLKLDFSQDEYTRMLITGNNGVNDNSRIDPNAGKEFIDLKLEEVQKKLNAVKNGNKEPDTSNIIQEPVVKGRQAYQSKNEFYIAPTTKNSLVHFKSTAAAAKSRWKNSTEYRTFLTELDRFIGVLAELKEAQLSNSGDLQAKEEAYTQSLTRLRERAQAYYDYKMSDHVFNSQKRRGDGKKLLNEKDDRKLSIINAVLNAKFPNDIKISHPDPEKNTQNQRQI